MATTSRSQWWWSLTFTNSGHINNDNDDDARQQEPSESDPLISQSSNTVTGGGGRVVVADTVVGLASILHDSPSNVNSSSSFIIDNDNDGVNAVQSTSFSTGHGQIKPQTASYLRAAVKKAGARSRHIIRNALRSGSSQINDDEEEMNDDEREESIRALAFRTHAVSGKDPSRRERIAFYIDTSTTGRWWELMDFTLNLAFSILYVFNSTYNDGKIPLFHHDLDCLLAIIILSQWLPYLWLSLNPEAYISALAIVSWAATLPVIFVFFMRPVLPHLFWGTYMDAGNIGLLYPFRFWRLHLSILRVVRPNKTFLFNFSPVTQKAVSIIVWILGLLLTVTAFVHMVERSGNPTLSFWDVFYWIFVTASSGLSTRIVQDTWVSRIVVLYVMVTGFLFLPPAMAELLELFRRKSKFDHSYKNSSRRDHIVLVGDLEVSAVRDFLREFYCEDHGPTTMTTHVVMMNPLEPTEELKLLFADPLYANRVTYIKGSTLNPHDLGKAKLRTSQAVFILSSDYADKDPSEIDAVTVMRAISLKKFAPGIKLFVQVLLPQNKHHFDSLADHVLCLDEFKLGILAQNMLAPGFTALINVLITSVPNASVKAFQKVNNNTTTPGGASSANNSNTNAINTISVQSRQWVREYVQGACMEIYPVVLSKAFAGLTFGEAAERLFLRHSITLFALAPIEDSDLLDDQDGGAAGGEPNRRCRNRLLGVRMNPTLQKLKGYEVAYVIARDSVTAERVTTEAEWLYESNRQGVMEWQQAWEFVPLLPGEGLEAEEVGGEESVVKKMTRKVKAATSKAMARTAGVIRKSAPPAGAAAVASGSVSGQPSGLAVPGAGEGGGVLSPVSDGASSIASAATEESEDVLGSQELLFSRKDNASVLDNPELTLAPSPADLIGASRSVVAAAGTGKAEILRSKSPPVPQPHSNMFTRMFKPSSAVGRVGKNAAGGGGGSPKIDFYTSGFVSPPPATRTETPTHVLSDEEDNDNNSEDEEEDEDDDTTTTTTRDCSHLKDHILICCLGLERNLPFLIAPIRRRSRDLPIVILCPVDLDVEEMQLLRAYRKVFVVKGSPLVRADLRRSGVEYAERAIVLASPTKASISMQTADAPVLLATLNIEVMSKSGAFINVEFLHPDNMRFIGSGEDEYSKFDLYGQTIIPAFVGGHVFSQAMLHTLLVQTYFNPHLLVILKHWLFPTLNTNPAPSTTIANKPINNSETPARARNTSTDSADSMFPSVKPTPTTTTSTHPCALGQCSPSVQHDQLFKYRVPRKWYGQRYALFAVRSLRDAHAVCLGLHRLETGEGMNGGSGGSSQGGGGGELGGEIRYVVVSPSQETRLRKGDYVFVLASSEPVM